MQIYCYIPILEIEWDCRSDIAQIQINLKAVSSAIPKSLWHEEPGPPGSEKGTGGKE
ncbi:hypothetical protein PLACP1_22590 [Planifilum fimeticola]